MIAFRAFATRADITRRPLWRLKQTYYHRLWSALTGRKWHEFERLMGEMRYRGLNLDEVTYTLKAHYCILNPHKPNMSCYLVIEEMKRALVHPAVIRMNENLINSYFELEELKCQPPFALWQNFTKFIWQTSFKLNRQRMQKLKASLQNMDPDDVLRLSDEDVSTLAQEEFLQAMFSSTLAIDAIYDEPIAIQANLNMSQGEAKEPQLAEPEKVGAEELAEGTQDREEPDQTFTEESYSCEEEDENEQKIDYEYVYEKQGRLRERATNASS